MTREQLRLSEHDCDFFVMVPRLVLGCRCREAGPT
jgi:hypothetical protein